jgi:hypothetical protein
MKKNLKRMFEIIDEELATRHDPDQLQVNEAQIQKLLQIHPATLTEKSDEDGPLIWILMIPTTISVMNDFIDGKISETQLLENTQPGDKYEAIYLCSATALPEQRRKGETKRLCLEAIDAIRREHKIKWLYVWTFSTEGEALANSVAKMCSLPLLIRRK